MPIQALIFDFDGLIVDTETPHYETWQGIYSEHGVELRLDRWLLDLGSHGMFDPCADLAELTGKTIDREAMLTVQRTHYLRLCEQEALRPGVAAMLEAGAEAGLGLAVATSSNREWVERWLAHHGIQHRFQCVRSRDDVERVKPAPDLFLAAAACLGIAPADCIVFEDSPNGMRAAIAAGMRCVAVPNSMTAALELPPVALRLPSLADLPLDALLQQLDAVAVPSLS